MAEKDPNERITVTHDKAKVSAVMTRKQLEKLYKTKGWSEVETKQDGELPKGTPPVVTPSGAEASAPAENGK